MIGRGGRRRPLLAAAVVGGAAEAQQAVDGVSTRYLTIAADQKK